MTKRYQLLSPRAKKDGGTYWHQIGSAWPRDNGTFSLTLDSLPIADKDGRVMILMSEPRERDDRQQPSSGMSSPRRTAYDAQAPQGGHADFSDEIPFAPEWRI